MTKEAKLVIGSVIFLVGLYVISFFPGSNWFSFGLLATIWGGWTIGEWLKNRHRS